MPPHDSSQNRLSAVLERMTLLHPKLIDLSLERINRLLHKLDNPQKKLPPIIHIAGTNGKGSVLATMRAIFEAAGMKTHAYTSPHLVRFNERIRLAGHLMDDESLAELLEDVEDINGQEAITFFEITTAAALYAFAQEPADITLLEVGLGGRVDSTNVIDDPVLSVITPIANDHEHFLGNTLNAIAQEKAGIMRQGIPCISAQQNDEVAQTLITHANTVEAKLLMAEKHFTITPHIHSQNALGHDIHGQTITLGERSLELNEFGLKGVHQQKNAGLAAAGIMHAYPHISDDIIRKGVREAEWFGRIQELKTGQLIQDLSCSLWLDGAHNAHGAEALAATLKTISDKPWTLICGALNTRNPEDFIKPLAPVISHAVTLTIPEQDASLSADELAGHVIRATNIMAEPAADIKQALKIAEEYGNNIIIAGSLYLAGHVLEQNGTLPQ